MLLYMLRFSLDSLFSNSIFCLHKQLETYKNWIKICSNNINPLGVVLRANENQSNYIIILCNIFQIVRVCWQVYLMFICCYNITSIYTNVGNSVFLINHFLYSFLPCHLLYVSLKLTERISHKVLFKWQFQSENVLKA